VVQHMPLTREGTGQSGVRIIRRIAPKSYSCLLCPDGYPSRTFRRDPSTGFKSSPLSRRKEYKFAVVHYWSMLC